MYSLPSGVVVTVAVKTWLPLLSVLRVVFTWPGIAV
jgi:hypothetical protein